MTDPWPYIIAAYALVIGGTVLLTLLSWRDMAAMEKAAGQGRDE